MRYRLMASYLGASYQAAVGPSDRDVTLFAAPPPPEEHGFSPAPGGIWRKQVRLDDLDALWESRPIGSYHGEPCLVLDDLGDRLHIVYLGMDERRAAQLGYWEVDRGVFEVVVPRHDVTDLAEERHEFPIALLLSALPRALGAGNQGPGGPGAGQNGAGRAIGAIGPGGAQGAGPVPAGAVAGPGGPGTGAMPGWNGPAGACRRPVASYRRAARHSFPRRCRSSPPWRACSIPLQAGTRRRPGRTAWGRPPAPACKVPPACPRVRRPRRTAAGRPVPVRRWPAGDGRAAGFRERPGPRAPAAAGYGRRAAAFPGDAVPGPAATACGPGAGRTGGRGGPDDAAAVPARSAAARRAAVLRSAAGDATARAAGGRAASRQRASGVRASRTGTAGTGAASTGTGTGRSTPGPGPGPASAGQAQAQAQAQAQQAQAQAQQAQAQQPPTPTAVAAWHGSPASDGNGNWYYQPGPDAQQGGVSANGYPVNGTTMNGYAAARPGHRAPGGPERAGRAAAVRPARASRPR